jgi:hypothetical protein
MKLARSSCSRVSGGKSNRSDQSDTVKVVRYTTEANVWAIAKANPIRSRDTNGMWRPCRKWGSLPSIWVIINEQDHIELPGAIGDGTHRKFMQELGRPYNIPLNWLYRALRRARESWIIEPIRPSRNGSRCIDRESDTLIIAMNRLIPCKRRGVTLVMKSLT